jgi:surface antigen
VKKIAMILAALALLVSACAPDLGPKETAGTLLGAGTGALLGSQFGCGRGKLVGVAVGTLAGALIGQGIGRSLDRADRAAMEKNARYGLENSRTGQTTTWVNPDTGISGTFTPERTYQADQGQYCREYNQTVSVAGKRQQVYGTACRQPDGTWALVNAQG